MKVSFYPGLEHRFVVVLSFLAQLSESDALVCDNRSAGRRQSSYQDPAGRTSGSQKTAEIAGELIDKACEAIKDEPAANYMLLRGFFREARTFRPLMRLTGFGPDAIAAYPMYRGVSKLLGMDVLQVSGDSISDEIEDAFS